MKCPKNMSVESGVLGENVPLNVVVGWKLVNSASLMETNVALIVLMVMETKNNDLATLRHAKSIAREVGVNTVLVLQLVMAVSRTGCTPSPERLLMAAKLVQEQVVLRKTMFAAQNNVRRIVWATGRIGACAPMAVLVQTAWNVDPAVTRLAATLSMCPTLQAAVLAMTRDPLCKTANCLVAQNHAKVPGANGASAKATTSKPSRERLRAAMARLKKCLVMTPSSVAQARGPWSSLLRSQKFVAVNAAQHLMEQRSLRNALQQNAQSIARAILKNLVNALQRVATARKQKSLLWINLPSMVERHARRSTVTRMAIPRLTPAS